MKSLYRQCPNGHGAMHRCYIRTSEHKIQRWHSIPWQYCPVCKMMLPYYMVETIARMCELSSPEML